MTKQNEYRRVYDKANTKGLYLKLNIRTDEDILSKLDKVDSKQGYIKELIRKDIKKEAR